MEGGTSEEEKYGKRRLLRKRAAECRKKLFAEAVTVERGRSWSSQVVSAPLPSLPKLRHSISKGCYGNPILSPWPHVNRD